MDTQEARPRRRDDQTSSVAIFPDTHELVGKDWVGVVNAALSRGRENYKFAALTIVEAMRADKALKQKKVAEAIGRSTTWVCRLLQWYHEGCPEGSIFGGEHSRDRIAPAQSQDCTRIPDEELGQLCLLGGSSDYVPGQREAIEKALTAMAACRDLRKRIAGITKGTLLLIFGPSANKQRLPLEKLVAELEKSQMAINVVLGEVRAARKTLGPKSEVEDGPTG